MLSPGVSHKERCGHLSRAAFGLLQDSLEDQAVRAMLWKCACIAHYAVIAHQFVVVARAVVGDGVWRAGVVAAGSQFGLIAMRQPVRELFNVTNMFTHDGVLSCGIRSGMVAFRLP